MTAVATPPAVTAALATRLRQLQLEKAELSADLVQRVGSALTDDARCRISGRLLEIDDELVDVWSEISAARELVAHKPAREREADRTDHQHLCAEIVDQWREQRRLEAKGAAVPVAECFRPGQGRSVPPIGLVWAAVREQWDVLVEVKRRLAFDVVEGALPVAAGG